MRLVGPPLPQVAFATVNESLRHAARGDDGLRLVARDESERFRSWAEIHDGARAVAAALMERGVAPGERVALVLPTGWDFVHGFYGAQLAGAVPVPLYPPVRLGRMDEYAAATARMLQLSGACVVLSDRRVRLLLGKAIELARPRLGCPTVSELTGGSNRAERATAADDLALIQFSSGSTVDPKPVALRHAQLLAQTAALKSLLPARPGTKEKGVSWLPLYHDMGLIGCLLLASYWPGELVLIPPEAFLARPALWLRALSRHRATLSAAPNFGYGLCLKRIRDDELEGVDLSSWTWALNGAEPVTLSTAEAFCARFARHGFRREAMLPVYGLSEASLAVTFPPARPALKVTRADPARLAATGAATRGSRAYVSLGVPVPGCEVELRDRSGDLVEPDQVGRVHVRGASVMAGYYGLREATAAVLRDGWLDTGDLGFVHDGELHLCGRVKDLVIVRGANHPPQEFEECLDGLAGVRAGCAVALGFVPPDEHEEALLLLVETQPPVPDDLVATISSAVVSRTGIRPHTVRLLAPGTLPRTSSGKLRRTEAGRRFAAGELSAPGPVNALSIGAEVAKSAVAHVKRVLART
jgi:acyl-CoA synthetase (AMP-forming)/AMP-acid ligase II